MAYINKETSAKIRKALKEKFGKDVKFSVSISHHTSLNVVILESKYFADGARFDMLQYAGINPLNNKFSDEQRNFIGRIDEVIRVNGNYFDESDAMTDYFHCAFYYDIKVGSYEKPHKQKRD